MRAARFAPLALSVALLGAPSRAAAREAPRAAASGAAAAPAVDLAWLGDLTGNDATARRAALSAIDATTPAMLPAVVRRLAELKKGADRDAMAAWLAQPRRAGESGDALDAALRAAEPGDAAFRDVASIFALSRALARIGTTPAVRELAGVYAAFGEPFRPEVERQLKALGERAVAALIELRRGEAKPLRPWASKMLEALGKTVPGEAVQTADHQVLADVLRAYGRTKDVDAARVIISFANSDRALVREAAREAVASLGEVGIWQLRESYENLVGKKPPEEWGWEKLSSELFVAYDKARLAEVYALMDEGVAAQRAGRLEAMASAFDRVLARAPAFERRREMIPGYFDFARSLRQTDGPRAMATLRRALRLDPTSPRAREMEAELAYLEAVDLGGRGLVDEAGYRRAIELNPSHAEAKSALERIQGASVVPAAGGLLRYAVASLLGFVALAGLAVATLFRPRARS